MEARAQEMRMALGAPKLITAGGAKESAKDLKAYQVPDVLDAAYRDVVKIPRYRQTAETIYNYLAEFDLLRKVLESRLGGGRTFPDAFTAMLGMEGAMLTRNQKALVLARTRCQLDLVALSRQIRCRFGSLSGSASPNHSDTHQMAGGEPGITPEGLEGFPTFREAGKGFTPATTTQMGL